MEKSRSQPLVEFANIAKGMCASGVIANCDVDDLTTTITISNLVPELIRMTCSMFGAWGKATPDGTLTQLRTLDFGTGPFANFTILSVYHPAAGNPFASVAFTGFGLSVTGFSSKVALSEKVWETYEGGGVQPGKYDGEPVVGVIRDMLQFSNTKEDAIAFATAINRTWAVFLGVGDNHSMEFRALAFRRSDMEAYGANNISNITGFAPVEDFVFIDKHPQPSHDPTTMPGLVDQYYGNITGALTASNFPRLMASGDLHVAVYDFGRKQAFISLGAIDANGNYGPDGKVWQACNRPFLQFDMETLWNMPKPT